ncbi:MAG: hypothetical protein P1V20_21545 [Verrucomicrobiales bacterium]|nr:hypothetical protein [Verrucomicrobiales bacterium]
MKTSWLIFTFGVFGSSILPAQDSSKTQWGWGSKVDERFLRPSQAVEREVEFNSISPIQPGKMWERLFEAESKNTSPAKIDLPADLLLSEVLDAKNLQKLERFQKAQLADVIKVCRKSDSPEQAGELLFDKSKTSGRKKAKQLEDYLRGFDLSWEKIKERTGF